MKGNKTADLRRKPANVEFIASKKKLYLNKGEQLVLDHIETLNSASAQSAIASLKMPPYLVLRALKNMAEAGHPKAAKLLSEYKYEGRINALPNASAIATRKSDHFSPRELEAANFIETHPIDSITNLSRKSGINTMTISRAVSKLAYMGHPKAVEIIKIADKSKRMSVGERGRTTELPQQPSHFAPDNEAKVRLIIEKNPLASVNSIAEETGLGSKTVDSIMLRLLRKGELPRLIDEGDKRAAEAQEAKRKQEKREQEQTREIPKEAPAEPQARGPEAKQTLAPAKKTPEPRNYVFDPHPLISPKKQRELILGSLPKTPLGQRELITHITKKLASEENQFPGMKYLADILARNFVRRNYAKLTEEGILK